MLTTHESAIPCDSDKAAAAHEESILYYDVVHTKVVVREAPSTAARAVATKVLGDIVCADAEVDGWAKLIDQSGWMLVDGAHVGLGALLKRRMPPSLSASAQKAGASSQRALSIVGDDGSHIVLRDGTLMPLLGLGTGGVPGLEGDDCVRLVTYAIAQCGVRLIDTAADYHNEEAVGEAIRRCGVPRSELFVCTKIGPLSQGHAACTASVRRSLQRMGLDYLDCVFIHWPGAWVAEQKEWGPQDWLNGRGVALAREYRAASWRALEDMKADGSVRHLGVPDLLPLAGLLALHSSSCAHPHPPRSALPLEPKSLRLLQPDTPSYARFRHLQLYTGAHRRAALVVPRATRLAAERAPSLLHERARAQGVPRPRHRLYGLRAPLRGAGRAPAGPKGRA